MSIFFGLQGFSFKTNIEKWIRHQSKGIEVLQERNSGISVEKRTQNPMLELQIIHTYVFDEMRMFVRC